MGASEMINLKKLLGTIALLSLGACAAPAISDIATDKVRVQSDLDDPKAATAEAERGCAIYNRVPVPLSKRTIRTGPYSSAIEYLYACQDPSGGNVTARTPAKPIS